jgi:negative regulator of sigma E activity
MTNRNQSHPTSDREALSALFDGELVGDAARFALKRLDHDHDWRETCERWQRVGDALRGQGALLPAAFPSRVRAAVRADAMRHDMHGVAIPAVANTRSGFRWGSVGLAASAAVVAFVLARMPMGDAGTAEPMVAASTAPAQPAQPLPPPTAAEPSVVDAATAVAAVTAAARPSQRMRNLQRDRAATDRIVSAAVAARGPVTGEAPVSSSPAVLEREVLERDAPERNIERAVADVPSVESGAVGDNVTAASAFGAVESRPWPRAVLPQLGGSGALAADYATTPATWPFVPREAPAAPPANEPEPATTPH